MPWVNLRLKTADSQLVTTADGQDFRTADFGYIAGDEEQNKRIYIEVYSPDANKDTLLSDSGGYIALLEPLDGTIIEHELRGRYDCTLYVPLDEDERWKAVQPYSRIKVPMRYHDEDKPQIFIVTTVEKSMDSSGKRQLRVTAEHNTYALAGVITSDVSGNPGASVIIGGAEGLNALLSAIKTTPEAATFEHAENMAAVLDDFEITSDISAIGGTGALPLVRTERINLIDYLFNTYAAQYDAHIYRDNFTIQIDKEMHDRRTAGTIRYGVNMTDVECTVDTSEVYTNVIASYDPPVFIPLYYEMPADDLEKMPYRRYKNIVVSSSVDSITEVSEDTLDQLHEIFMHSAEKWAEYHFKPLINLSVSFADIEHNAEYEGFLGLRQYEVGDLVSVYHEGLDITFTEREIIRTRFDVCRQKITDIEIGDFRASIARENYDFSNIREV